MVPAAEAHVLFAQNQRSRGGGCRMGALKGGAGENLLFFD